MKTALKLAQSEPETFRDGVNVVGTGVKLPESTPQEVVIGVITFLLGFVAIIAMGVFIWGAFKYLTSLGDETKASSAKKAMLYSVLGLVLVMVAYVIIRFVRTLLGV